MTAQITSRVRVTALAMGISLATLLVFVGSAYETCARMDSDLRFLSPLRPPSVDEAMISCPVEYAIHSTEENDVIFLGGSSCRCGIDPRLLGGIRAYNLGSVVGLKPDGIFVTARAYFLHHPPPKAVMLCLSPLTFDFGVEDAWSAHMTRPFVLNYGSEAGSTPPFAEISEYFVRRGFAALWNAHRHDPRDVPLDGMASDTYRTFGEKIAGSRGYLGMPGEHAPVIRIEYPGRPVHIEAEWEPFIRRLAAECGRFSARLIVRITPISVEESQRRNFAEVNEWARRLSGDNITVPQPSLVVYQSQFMWDNVHLNRAGIEKFMPVVAQDVQAVLGK